MTARSRWLILALALVGLGFAASSTWVHYRLLTDPSYISPCDLNATFNCSQVYLSPLRVSCRSTGRPGRAVLVRARRARRRVCDARAVVVPSGTYLFALATIGLAVIFYLGYASFVVLKTACILCLGTYAAVVGIFIITGSTSSVPMSQIPARLFSDVIVGPASSRRAAGGRAALRGHRVCGGAVPQGGVASGTPGDQPRRPPRTLRMPGPSSHG